MYFLALFLLATVSSVLAGSLNTEPCIKDDSETGEIIEVYSSNYGQYDDIILQRGSTYNFGIRFTAGENSIGLEPTVYLIMLGVKIQSELGINSNACEDLQDSNKCPLVAGRTYNYSSTITVSKGAPNAGVILQWGLTSKSASGVKGKNQACFQVEAKIR